jgi:hypothetical protein
VTTGDPACLARSLSAAAERGFPEWCEELVAHLADDVEILHTPPVPHLDGWRGRAQAAAYLREEAVAFPRAFSDDFGIRASIVPTADGVAAEFVYHGTLRAPERTFVEIAFALDIVVGTGGIVRLTGIQLPTTTRSAMISWLRAVEANGGFHPPEAIAV